MAPDTNLDELRRSLPGQLDYVGLHVNGTLRAHRKSLTSQKAIASQSERRIYQQRSEQTNAYHRTALVEHLRTRLNQPINANLRYTFGR